jgi:hypothetical protein
MSNSKRPSMLATRRVAMLTLALFLWAGPVWAQITSANYTCMVGAGFLCDSGDSSACPAVVKSANGDSYEMTGAGAFTAPNKSVTAAGTFTHRSADGMALETGVWIANELVSFDSYGIEPGALLREGRALGQLQFALRRFGIFSGATAAGGLAVLRIRLLPAVGFARNATLQVNCALGKVPDEHPTEGIRLSFEGRGAEFDQEVSGRALFLLTRPGASPAAKAPAPEADTKPAPTEVQQ